MGWSTWVPADEDRCTATNRRGTRCSRYARHGYRTCAAHMAQEPAPPPPASQLLPMPR